MRRKSVLLGFITFILLGGGVLVGLVLAVQHEPGFYHRVAIPPGKIRQKVSEDFNGRLLTFLGSLREQDKWDFQPTQDQVNSYFEEDFVRSPLRPLFPEGITDPRIQFEKDCIRLGFRYHLGRWSTIISVNMRVWLAAEASNVVVLELQAMRAGSLPVSVQSLLERLTEVAERYDIKVSWYRHNGNPVAVLRFPGNQPSSTVQLELFDIQPGKVVIRGQSVEPGSHPPAGKAKGQKP